VQERVAAKRGAGDLSALTTHSHSSFVLIILEEPPLEVPLHDVQAGLANENITPHWEE